MLFPLYRLHLWMIAWEIKDRLLGFSFSDLLFLLSKPPCILICRGHGALRPKRVRYLNDGYWELEGRSIYSIIIRYQIAQRV